MSMLRFRVRTMILLVAIAALVLFGIDQAARLRRRARDYREMAEAHRVTEGIMSANGIREEAAYHGERRAIYEHAASRPWATVPAAGPPRAVGDGSVSPVPEFRQSSKSKGTRSVEITIHVVPRPADQPYAAGEWIECAGTIAWKGTPAPDIVDLDLYPGISPDGRFPYCTSGDGIIKVTFEDPKAQSGRGEWRGGFNANWVQGIDVYIVLARVKSHWFEDQ
ncbi:MAG TPA: hypothetical protein VGZ22_19235 [Isosphaeraceae bacterium]|jgi:hypothetical protein|nr:hypothetical protein [Isosphaeraceae bacterium]